MSQFHAFCGDSTASESSTSFGEETFRSPSLSPNITDYGLRFSTSRARNSSPRRARKSSRKASTSRRSRSTDVTPPQSQTINTPKRGKSAGSSQGRRIDMSSSFEDSQPRVRVRSELHHGVPSPRASTSKVNPPKNKRKQNRPKKVEPTKALKEIYTLQHSTSEFSLPIFYFRTYNLLRRVTNSKITIQSFGQRDSDWCFREDWYSRYSGVLGSHSRSSWDVLGSILRRFLPLHYSQRSYHSHHKGHAVSFENERNGRPWCSVKISATNDSFSLNKDILFFFSSFCFYVNGAYEKSRKLVIYKLRSINLFGSCTRIWYCINIPDTYICSDNLI